MARRGFEQRAEAMRERLAERKESRRHGYRAAQRHAKNDPLRHKHQRHAVMLRAAARQGFLVCSSTDFSELRFEWTLRCGRRRLPAITVVARPKNAQLFIDLEPIQRVFTATGYQLCSAFVQEKSGAPITGWGGRASRDFEKLPLSAALALAREIPTRLTEWTEVATTSKRDCLGQRQQR